MRRTKVLTADRALGDTWLEVPIRDGLLVVNAALGTHFRAILSRNCTLAVIGGSSGRRVLLRLEQDGTGGRTVTADSTLKSAVTVAAASKAVTWLDMAYDEVGGLWEAVATSGASGANTALSNLVSLAINTSLVSDTDNTDDLGTSSISWRQLFIGDSIVMKNATKIQANGGSSGTIYFDTAAIHLSFSAKPVSLWTGTFLGFDEAVSLGATPGTTGFGMASANFECKYTGTLVWRLESTTTMFLNDGVNLKMGVSTGSKIGTTSAQKIGKWGAPPVVQPGAIADVSGGVVVDSESRTAINAILAALRAGGNIAT